MADGEGSRTTDATSSQNQDELVKVAQNEIAQAMNKAMNNISTNSKDNEPSEPLKQNLSEEKQVFEENVDYVEPMQDPYNKAIKYLENHNILQLFQQLTASIVYTKPERPLEHMMQEVERMKKERDQEQSQQKKS
ncbi:uncharacterized protein LOC123540343 [Mercenaria mercenaria]|uniref:uncharacterized protein LOC123540343 n=1 Tax=Mercenaria mercenaria TaxID=6596 RepID=UPI00234E8399|nr:uncharacterized protein LOC123540343 [Mercenaria mercenaria]